MVFWDTLYKMATFQSKYFIVSLLFYLFIFLLIDLLAYQIRTRQYAFGEPDKALPERQRITDRLKSVFGLDDREWEAEDKKQYVRGLSKGKQPGAEDGGEEFLQVVYRADDVQSLEFSEDNGAFLFPYKITVNGKAVSQEKDATVRQGQLLNVIGKLKEMDIRELQETVACCREREGSQILTQLLAENRIAHHVISGYQAYSHELYRHMMDVLYVLYRPMDAQVQLNLYKVLPVMKEALYEILQYNEKKGVFLDTKERKHFAQIDYGRFLAHSGFKEVITELLQMSQSIGTAPMRGYVPRLFTLLKKYYWNWKKQYNSCIERDEFFEKRVLTYFSADCTFSEFLDQHSRNKQFCATNQNNQRGLAVSTFHGLKGLEFDTVFMINLDNDIFPNYSLIDSKDYPEQVKQQLKEAEVRLFYVALTRARDTLYLYYQQNNPSSYVKDLLGASYQENHLVYDVDNLKDTGLPAVEEEDDLSFLLEDDDEEEVSLLGDTAIEVGACSTGNVDEFRQDENGGDEMRRMVNSGDEMERDRTSGLQFSNSFMEKMLSNF